MKKICMLILALFFSVFFIFHEKSTIIHATNVDITPIISHSGGFYTDSFYLEITPKAGTSVYYTLDGSTPNESSIKYETPLWIEETWIDKDHDEIVITKETPHIPEPLSFIRTAEAKWLLPQEDIFKATVLKVIAVDHQTKEVSQILTETYFVAPDMFDKYRFPIISLSTDAKNLFDYDTGIHVPGVNYDYRQENHRSNRTGNYFQTGDQWERPVYVEYFLNTGLKVMSQHAGIRIHGGLSRQYPIKSYRLYARNEYDEQNTFAYPFFEDESIKSYKRLILRNGGQAYQYSFFGDAFIHQLLKPLSLDIQDSQPVIVFMNGEYFGIRNLRERLDKHYLNEHYGLDENSVSILAGHAYYEDGSKRGALHYQTMYAYANTRDLSNQKHFSVIKRWMDTDQFIDYMIAELYTGNSDWPQNNILYWRKNTTYAPNAPYGHDGRWRWMINDMDASFGISFGTTKPETNSLERMTGDSWKTGKLFVNLLENESFKSQFIYRYFDLMNTIFDHEHVERELDNMVELYQPEMEEHIERFGYPQSMNTWLAYVERMRTFSKDRKMYVTGHLEDYFGLNLKQQLLISFDHSKGSVSFYDEKHTTGHIEKEVYENLLIKLTASPKENHYFDGWYLEEMKISADEILLLKPDQMIGMEARFIEGNHPSDDQRLITPVVITSVFTLFSISSLLIVLKKHHFKHPSP